MNAALAEKVEPSRGSFTAQIQALNVKQTCQFALKSVLLAAPWMSWADTPLRVNADVAAAFKAQRSAAGGEAEQRRTNICLRSTAGNTAPTSGLLQLCRGRRLRHDEKNGFICFSVATRREKRI